jgi:DNA invertase Pin-like site-specific DNA recombinase
MRLPAMITAITAEVGRRGRSQTAVRVQHGELPRPAPCGSYSTISEAPADFARAKGRDKRPAFDALCRAAARREFDLVMAWSVDRLGRSLQDLVSFLSELHALKIDLFLHQQGLDTTTPAGKAMFQMMGVFAEFERAMIQERVRAGLARAKSEGKRLGRPPIDPALEKRIREALAAPDRPGVRKIAARFGINPGTVQRISRPFEPARSRQARSPRETDLVSRKLSP